MRFRIPKYFPGWFVSGGGGSGGAATVQTDGVTIQGDGSAGNKIAILAVQTDATLTGAGTVASPLSAVTQTPTGWPLPYFQFGVAAASATGLASPVNTLQLVGIWILAQLRFSNVTVIVGTADAVNNYDIGMYNAAGTRAWHIGAQTIPSTGIQTFAVAGAPITINPGLYFWATTAVVNTATIYTSGTTAQTLLYFSAFNQGATVGGAIPASITPPAKSISRDNMPFFALS